MEIKQRFKLSSAQVIIFGFAGVIILATLLLMMPFSSADGKFTNFLDAAFTATSATCVTGLVVYDTATHWSVIGQVIILFLTLLSLMEILKRFICQQKSGLLVMKLLEFSQKECFLMSLNSFGTMMIQIHV